MVAAGSIIAIFGVKKRRHSPYSLWEMAYKAAKLVIKHTLEKVLLSYLAEFVIRILAFLLVVAIIFYGGIWGLVIACALMFLGFYIAGKINGAPIDSIDESRRKFLESEK